MAEPNPNPTPAPAPEPTPEKTFTQAEVDTLIGKRLAKAMKGMPDEAELTAFRAWKENQQSEQDRVNTLTSERDTARTQLTAAQAEIEQYKTQIADRDYLDAAMRSIAGAGIKFSSKAAEKAYIADLKANRLETKDGKLVGFDDYHKAQVEADPSAFQSDKPAPVFVKPVGAGGPPAAESKGAMYAKQFNAQYAPTTTKE